MHEHSMICCSQNLVILWNFGNRIANINTLNLTHPVKCWEAGGLAHWYFNCIYNMLVLHYDHGSSSDGVTFLSYDKSFEVSYDESSLSVIIWQVNWNRLPEIGNRCWTFPWFLITTFPVASTVLDHVTVGLFVVFMYNIYVYMLGSLF